MAAELLRELGASALAASVAIVLVLCLRRMLRAYFGARVAYALWIFVPLASTVTWLPVRVVVTYVPAVVETAEMRASAAATNRLPDSGSALSLLALMWMTGVAVALGSALRRQRRFVRALGLLQPTAEADVWRAATVTASPALVGALRPRIVVPLDFEARYNAAQRALVLVHERLHRARGDAQVNAFATLVCCAFWFNPLVYFAASRFRFDQELACDAAVMERFPRARRRYAEAMLNTQLADLGLPAGCHWQSCHPLKERIAMLKQILPGRARRACGIGVTVVLVACGSVAVWAAQPVNEVARSAGAARIRGDITLRIDGGAEHRLAIVTWPGVEFAVADGDAEHWELRGTASPRADGTIELETVVRHGDAIVGEPRLITQDGISAAVRVDDATSRLDASFVLSRADMPKAAAAPAATEDLSFRAMQPPHYPLAAVKAHQQGRVVLQVHVDERGTPRAAQVAESVPAEVAQVFSEASIAAAMQWRYNPATVDGKAAPGDVAVPIDYRLIDE